MISLVNRKLWTWNLKVLLERAFYECENDTRTKARRKKQSVETRAEKRKERETDRNTFDSTNICLAAATGKALC